MTLTDQQPFFIHTMGRSVRVTAIFTDEAAANAFMAQTPGHGVIDVYGPYIFLASVYAKGTELRP
jgi:hypothetical protein